MEILINELSLFGQYATVDEFAEQALPSLLLTLRDFNPAKDQLFKKEDFYTSKITNEHTLHDLIIGRLSRKYDEIKRFKSLLANLFEDPYWEADMRQSADSKYTYKTSDIWGSSLAEACERDKVVLSFVHEDFSDRVLAINKDSELMNIENLFDKGHYLELCWQRKYISFEDYCKGKFAGNKLEFSQISSREGFNLIVSESDQRIFLDGFRKFSELTWHQISVDDGLDYKEFNNRKFFRDIPYQIHKFRINQRYRCFGYINEGVFYVLLFDLDHRLSDLG